MPSMSKPMGSVPETKEQVKDVKQEAAPSPSPEVKEPDVEVTETDLEELGESQKIPYTRFKEKNEEAKRLKAELARANERHQEDLRRVLAEKEALASIKPREESPFEMIDPAQEAVKTLQQQIASLSSELKEVRGQTSEDRLKAQLNSLQSKYPEADQLAVMGWKKIQRDADLEDLMEQSHTRNMERAQKVVTSIIEKKKAKKSMPIAEQVGFKLKDSEKPKNVREANALLRRLIGG